MTSIQPRGPQRAATQPPVNVRLSPEVLTGFRATGKGWQTRLDAALKNGSPSNLADSMKNVATLGRRDGNTPQGHPGTVDPFMMVLRLENHIYRLEDHAMSTYDQDVVAWSQEQAHLLRIGQFSALDIEHLAEEIEDVGRSEQRELTHRMAILLAHLLKWQYQPERRGTGWALTINGQRERIIRRLQKTPSLKSALNDVDGWADAWLDARIEATQETGIEIQRFPPECPWTTDEILDPAWTPAE